MPCISRIPPVLLLALLAACAGQGATTTGGGNGSSSSSGGGGGGYFFVCVEDLTTASEEPNGLELDAIQDYDGDLDHFADTTTCTFGPNADANGQTCDAIKVKDQCGSASNFITLGGTGGWACGRFTRAIANDDIVTPNLCDVQPGTGRLAMKICQEADPTSSTCRDCPLDTSGNRSCRVAGL